ncbi:MAG TPA: TIGR00282 family metallophosphoesterase [Candidatus Omnitrophota bacterium]|nr:TIGR00282 family metallophosphoesterase [Candidatus Omnitrophota bacterium]
MKILCIGDIVGKPGRAAVEGLLDKLKKKYDIEFVVANAENTAGGAGLTSRLAKVLFRAGCDVLTLGDHVWDQKELEQYLNTTDKVIRPANFPSGVPGRGWCVHATPSGHKVGVINLLGRVFMRHNVESPFMTLKEIVKQIKKETPIIIVDFHAETTSEKVAMGHFIDGEVSAIVGTHTHITTSDEKILPKKTAYITDLGMTGPYDSVIGQDKEAIIQRFLTSMPVKFHVASGNVELHGAVIDVDAKSGKADSIERISCPFEFDEKKASSD